MIAPWVWGLSAGIVPSAPTAPQSPEKKNARRRALIAVDVFNQQSKPGWVGGFADRLNSLPPDRPIAKCAGPRNSKIKLLAAVGGAAYISVVVL